jgi:hypothetical protein
MHAAGFIPGIEIPCCIFTVVEKSDLSLVLAIFFSKVVQMALKAILMSQKLFTVAYPFFTLEFPKEN